MGGSDVVRRIGWGAVAAVLLAAGAGTGASSAEGGATAGGPVAEAAVGAQHLEVQLELGAPSGSQGATSSVAGVDADLVDGPAPRSRGGEVSSQQVLVVGRDAAGVERWRSAVADPRVRRLETADADGHLSGTTVRRADATLEVSVPAKLGVVEVAVYEAGPDGAPRALGTAALPDAVTAAAAVASAGTDPTTSSIGDNRIDIAVLGDGYTSAQQAKFATDVSTVMAGFFAEDPYAEYQSYFRVNQVPVVSNQSGADHLERVPPTYRDTALGAEYGCFAIARLLCIDEAKVAAKVNAALPAAKRDIVLVLVNDTTYGGSGGVYAVASLDPSAVELALHEIGHSFGGLADEYSGNNDDPSCVLPATGVNVTSQTSRTKIPWKHWIDQSTPVPTGGSTPSLPGLYAGAAYCDTGAYRPTYDSKMRTLGSPWDPINQEQLIEQMYRRVGPIDSSSPSGSVLARQSSGLIELEVVPMQPATHDLTAFWTVDGAPAGNGRFFSDSWEFYGDSGKHRIEAWVEDQTPDVRSDPDHVLREIRTWRIPDRLEPFATWGAFVDQTFLDLRGRFPTTDERTLWTTALANGTSDRADLVENARRGSDGTGNVDPTVRLYRAFLQRTPDAGGLRYWVGRKRSGAWTLTRMADQFATSSEFQRTYGALTNRQFVTRIYTDVLGRAADVAGVNYWTGRLDAHAKTRGQVMVGFSESSEYRRKQAENTDVAVAYIYLLGRKPSALEVADWTSREKAGLSNAELAKELVTSSAYAARFPA